MDDVKTSEAHMTSAAAFVEGGIQDAFDDSCSICLEAFCGSDPSTVTSCKHEFHLHCILEWCQRSSNCPMCWQSISLKDPACQELLEAVEQERRVRIPPARNAAIFHHPMLSDFGLQHLPDGVNDAELEDRIIQHLAAAAAMGRARHIARREGSRSRSAAHANPRFLVFSTHTNASGSGSSVPIPPVGAESYPAPASPSLSQTIINSESSVHAADFGLISNGQISAPPSGSVILPINPQGISSNSSPACISPVSQERAGPSDFHSFSESWKSRLNSMSMKYKDSLSKSTRGWKEKLFSRGTSLATISTEVKREVNAGIASVSRVIESLETRQNGRDGPFSASENHVEGSLTETTSHDGVETHSDHSAFAANTASR